MSLPIQLISTDFDGTLFAEFEKPPIPPALLDLIAGLQAQGVRWVINTGREMASLMELLARARVSVKPDYLILVEREIYFHQASQYLPSEEWNEACRRDHEALFKHLRRDLPRLVSWVNARFNATVYEDAYSPFCLIAQNAADAETICSYLEEYCQELPGLQLVRNDIYARFAHVRYNKGTALDELARQLKILPEAIFAAGDHLNDLPMLLRARAQYLTAPANAVSEVKELVRQQGGYVSSLPQGSGVLDGLYHYLKTAGGTAA